ncbi:uncharacterized protein LOC144453251 [Glandiceps talaboti]
MTLYMPPMSRKKKIDDHYDPDSRRVFNTDSEGSSPTGETHYSSTHHGKQRKQWHMRPLSPDRNNRPHPGDVGFLRQNVALLNEPICYVDTKGTRREQSDWWPSRTSSEPMKKPTYSKASTMRSDYEYSDKSKSAGLTRHGCNPHTDAAHGIVPINGLYPKKGPRLLVEHISYEHQYDSRNSANNPVRGKRHGSFVWDILHPVNPPADYVPTPPSSSVTSPHASSGTLNLPSMSTHVKNQSSQQGTQQNGSLNSPMYGDGRPTAGAGGMPPVA